MASIVIDLDASRLQPYIQEIIKRTTDWRPVMRRLGMVAMRTSAQKFAAQGPGWRPLSRATLLRRRGGGAKAKILQDTGRLRQSVVSAEQRSPGSIYNLQQTSLEIGSNLVYAAIHQFGGVIKQAGGRQGTLNFVRRGKGFRFSTADGRSGRGKRKLVALQAKFTSGPSSITIPARPFLPTLAEMEDDFIEVVRDYLTFDVGA